MTKEQETFDAWLLCGMDWFVTIGLGCQQDLQMHQLLSTLKVLKQ
jgi:hypothetical protein